MAITVVLVRPVIAGNVGAVARVMANFNAGRLVLVAPECDHLGKEASDRAKHAKRLLQKAKVVKSLKDVKADIKVGTTARLGSDYNLHRTPLLPAQLASVLPDKQDIALVFGPEGPGLSNDELLQCDLTVTIPTTKEYPSMNLSHAVCAVLYAIAAARASDHIASHYPPMTAVEHKQILRMVDDLIASIHWSEPSKAATQRKLWRNIVGKSFLTKREAYALMGFLHQMGRQLTKK
jgi:TrmH family RNA methyltransferase